MVRVMDELHKRFGRHGSLPEDLPLFTNMHGQWVARDGFVKTIESMAQQIGVQLIDELGRNTAGEHVLESDGSSSLSGTGHPHRGHNETCEVG